MGGGAVCCSVLRAGSGTLPAGKWNTMAEGPRRRSGPLEKQGAIVGEGERRRDGPP